MIRKITALVFASLLLSVSAAYADDYDDCIAACNKTQQDCIDGITLFDATGVAEAKAVCVSQFPACKQNCHVMDDMGKGAYEEQQRKVAEEAERKKQEQESASNGIKTYDNDNAIKTYVFQ